MFLNNYKNKKGPQGFTLIEVIVSLAVSGVIAIMVLVIAVNGFKNVKSVVRSQRLYSNASVVLNSVDYWVKQARDASVSPGELQVFLPDSSVKIFDEVSGRILINGEKLTADNVEVVGLDFTKLPNSVRMAIKLKSKNGPETFSATTTVAFRNGL